MKLLKSISAFVLFTFLLTVFIGCATNPKTEETVAGNENQEGTDDSVVIDLPATNEPDYVAPDWNSVITDTNQPDSLLFMSAEEAEELTGGKPMAMPEYDDGVQKAYLFPSGKLIRMVDFYYERLPEGITDMGVAWGFFDYEEVDSHVFDKRTAEKNGIGYKLH